MGVAVLGIALTTGAGAVTLNPAGMASAVSLRALLARARAAGKEVVVHLPLGGGTKEVIVASAAALGQTATFNNGLRLGWRL